MGRTEKASTVAELRERLCAARGAVLTDFRGLSVAEITELRTLLRKGAVEYTVVKNTLARRAIRDTELAGLAPYFEGPTAVAISRTDPVAASRILSAWGKGRPALPFKGGVVEGRIVGPAEVAGLASLPSREVLLACVASAFQTPLQGLVNVLGGPLRALVTVLERVRQQKGEPGSPGGTGREPRA